METEQNEIELEIF